MPATAKYGRKAFGPATVAGIVAAVGTAGFFFMTLGPDNAPEGRGYGMISAAVVYQAGATMTPSIPAQ